MTEALARSPVFSRGGRLHRAAASQAYPRRLFTRQGSCRGRPELSAAEIPEGKVQGTVAEQRSQFQPLSDSHAHTSQHTRVKITKHQEGFKLVDHGSSHEGKLALRIPHCPGLQCRFTESLTELHRLRKQREISTFCSETSLAGASLASGSVLMVTGDQNVDARRTVYTRFSLLTNSCETQATTHYGTCTTREGCN